MVRVGLYTLGCKVSQYETEAISEKFEAEGALICPFSQPCDIYVINTCTVTAESDRKSRQFIRRAIKQNPDAVVCVLGCYSQRAPSEAAAISGVDIVIGTHEKLTVVPLALKMLKERKAATPCEKIVTTSDVWSVEFENMKITKAPRTRAYVKIEDGCECRCTYCAISAARGRVRSKPREDVLAEVKALFDSGIGEVVLTGIETGSYGKDFPDSYSLADLIVELDRLCPNGRIRLGSLSPELCGEEFVEKVSKTKILLPHFHLSMQSGSDAVLLRMKRRYSRAMALRNISRLKSAFRAAHFTTDLMVGFPGESEEDFLKTMDFVSEAPLLDAHVFAYSKREGTPAATYEDQIDERVKSSRSERLIERKNLVREQILASILSLGEPLSAIIESYDGKNYLLAHSESFVEIKIPLGSLLPADIIGRWVKVAPVSHSNGILYCEII